MVLKQSKGSWRLHFLYRRASLEILHCNLKAKAWVHAIGIINYSYSLLKVWNTVSQSAKHYLWHGLGYFKLSEENQCITSLPDWLKVCWEKRRMEHGSRHLDLKDIFEMNWGRPCYSIRKYMDRRDTMAPGNISHEQQSVYSPTSGKIVSLSFRAGCAITWSRESSNFDANTTIRCSGFRVHWTTPQRICHQQSPQHIRGRLVFIVQHVSSYRISYPGIDAVAEIDESSVEAMVRLPLTYRGKKRLIWLLAELWQWVQKFNPSISDFLHLKQTQSLSRSIDGKGCSHISWPAIRNHLLQTHSGSAVDAERGRRGDSSLFVRGLESRYYLSTLGYYT